MTIEEWNTRWVYEPKRAAITVEGINAAIDRLNTQRYAEARRRDHERQVLLSAHVAALSTISHANRHRWGWRLAV
jgi:hypothetical protein